jgi:hypothetical protein
MRHQALVDFGRSALQLGVLLEGAHEAILNKLEAPHRE